MPDQSCNSRNCARSPRGSSFTNLEWRRNNSAHGGNPKTKRIHLSCPSLLKNARTNLLFASSRPFLWPQGIPRFVQHGLQKLESFWGQCSHDTNQRRLICFTNRINDVSPVDPTHSLDLKRATSVRCLRLPPLSCLGAKDFFRHWSTKALDTAPAAKRMAQIMMTHQTELATAVMTSFHECFSLVAPCQKFVHQITSQITQPIKVTALKVATIPR